MTITIRTRTKPQYHADPAPVTVPEIAPAPVNLTAEQRQNMMTALFQAPIDDAGMTDSNAALNNLRAEISQLRAANAHLNNACGALTDANLKVDVLTVCVTDRDRLIATLRAELEDSRIEASNLAGKLLDAQQENIILIGELRTARNEISMVTL